MPLSPTGLELILPAGTDRWVGLLLSEPDALAGTYEEVTDSEYARVSCSTWTNVDNGDGRLARRNSGALVFNGIVDVLSTVVTHWGIFDAGTNGNLLASGPILNSDGEAEPMTIPIDDQPRFNDGDLALLGTC